MNRNIVLATTVAASALLGAGCAATAPASPEVASTPTAPVASPYFAGNYSCAVSKGSGFEIDDLFIGGRFDHSHGGKLVVDADGSWRTPTSDGTWLLRGNTLTISATDAGKAVSVDVPGFPATPEAASTASTLVISHPSYSGDRTVITARATGAGFELTNETGARLNCARG